MSPSLSSNKNLIEWLQSLRRQNFNYRPVANLCSASKIYERLILQRIQDIEDEKKVDFNVLTCTLVQKGCHTQYRPQIRLLCAKRKRRQKKKSTYQSNHFVCTKTTFLSGDQVTQDYSSLLATLAGGLILYVFRNLRIKIL